MVCTTLRKTEPTALTNTFLGRFSHIVLHLNGYFNIMLTVDDI